MATSFNPVKMPIVLLNSPTPKTLLFIPKFLNILYRTEIYIVLAYFCLTFVAMDRALCSLKNSYSIWILQPRNPIIYAKIVTISRTELKSVLFCFFCFFCVNSVGMETRFVPLKFLLAYLNSLTPKTLLYIQALSPYLVQNWNLCNLFFLPNFVCRGNSLGFVGNSGSVYLNSTTPYTLLYVRKIPRFFATNWNAILAYFCPNLVGMATPLTPLKIQLAHLNSPSP